MTQASLESVCCTVVTAHCVFVKFLLCFQLLLIHSFLMRNMLNFRPEIVSLYYRILSQNLSLEFLKLASPTCRTLLLVMFCMDLELLIDLLQWSGNLVIIFTVVLKMVTKYLLDTHL